MLDNLRLMPDPALTHQCRRIKVFNRKLKALSDTMFRVMYDNHGVGLAANQIGVMKRMFVYDLNGQKGTVINPVILQRSGSYTESEGCLSIPGRQDKVERAGHVVLSGQDLSGERMVLEGDAMLAKLFQHETDHLLGILYLNHLGET